MAIQTINVGTTANDGTGNSLRTSFIICNNNFSYLNSIITGNGNIISANSLTANSLTANSLTANSLTANSLTANSLTANSLTANTSTVNGNVYLGQSMSFVPTNANLQIAGTQNNYFQVQLQNKSNGTAASTDYVATADNGSDSDTYIDMGINGSTYSQAAFNLTKANDGYLYVYGNTTTGGGNLVLSTFTARDIIFSTNGSTTANEIARIKNNTGLIIGTNVVSTGSGTGALQVTGGAAITGNAYVGAAVIASNGTVSTGTFTGSYSNGIVSDFVTGMGRISVSGYSGLTIYNLGLANTPLLAVDSSGNATVSGTIIANIGISTVGTISANTVSANSAVIVSNITVLGNIIGTLDSQTTSGIKSVGTLANLVVAAGGAIRSSSNSTGWNLSNVQSTSYTVLNNFGSNATTATIALSYGAPSRVFIDVNANCTFTYGNITTGVDHNVSVRNRSAGTANIIMPNSNNNKGSNVIPISTGVTAAFRFIAADATAANVVAIITSN